MKAFTVIVMGVSGSGKSTVAQQLGARLNASFIDGDDLHPRANVEKMAAGAALTDTDRQPWLVRIRDAVFSLQQRNRRGVIVCSALKARYRDIIREGNQALVFLFLDGDEVLIASRMTQRQGHFMKTSMLRSQFEALERPAGEDDVITLPIDQPLEALIDQAQQAILHYYQVPPPLIE